MTAPASPPPLPTASPGRSVLGLLADRTFGPYFLGNLLSNCGQWFQTVAGAVVVFRMTGSAVMVGILGVLQFAGPLVLTPWAGAVSDRADRRRMLLGSQLLAAGAATVLAVWTALVGVDGLPGPWPVMGSALVIGVAFAFSVPAMQALIPALVPSEDLDQAIALNSVTFNLARAVGPALAGIVLVTAGPAAAFGANALSYLPLVAVLLVIRARPVTTGGDDGDGDGSVRAGLRFVRSRPTLLVLLAGVAALGVGLDPIVTLGPALAEALGGGDGLVAWIVSAFGAGSVAGAFVVAPLRRRWTGEPLAAGGLGLLAVGMALTAASSSPTLALAALGLAGMGFLLGVTALTSAIQQRVPEALRGRVMALWGVAFLGSRPFAALLHGTIGDLVGPRPGFLVAAAIAGAAAALVGRRPAR